MKIVTLSLLFAVTLLSANESKITLECYPHQFMLRGEVTRTLTRAQAIESGLQTNISYTKTDMTLDNASNAMKLKHVDTQMDGDISVEIYKDVEGHIRSKINPKDITSLAMDWGNRIIINYNCDVK